MKTIGIIGGLSPESTLFYYKHINDLVREMLGGHHSAKIILWSVDFAEFCALKEKGDWGTQGFMLADAAKSLEQAGADFIVLATNTMHKMAQQIQDATSIPFLHIADVTADVILDQKFERVGFIGTKYSMEMDFYRARLEAKGIKVSIPHSEADRKVVSDIIYNELTKGVVSLESETEYVRVINGLKERGCEAVILGCTEITYLIGEHNSPLPVLDTTQIHVDCAVEFALND